MQRKTTILWITLWFCMISTSNGVRNRLGARVSLCDLLPGDDWTVGEHGGQCYEFVPNKELWSTARARCRRANGKLVTVGDASTKDFLVGALRKLGWSSSRVWIGLNDKEDEGSWEWVGGTDEPSQGVTWTDWAPSGWLSRLTGPAQDCVSMDPEKGWRWRDVVCSLALGRYVCQFDIPPAPTVTVASQPSTVSELGMTTIRTSSLDNTDVQQANASKTHIAALEIDDPPNTGMLRMLGLGIGLCAIGFIVLMSICIIHRRPKDTALSSLVSPAGTVIVKSPRTRRFTKDLYTPSPRVPRPPAHSAPSDPTGGDIPRGLAQKIVEPYGEDELYLHMGGTVGKTPRVVCAAVAESHYANRDSGLGDYDGPEVYYEIDEEAHTYQTIDEIKREMGKM